MTRIQELKDAVIRGKSLLQASNEIDFPVFYDIHNLLKNFTNLDWENLKMDLPKWEDKELEVLAVTLHQGNGFGEVLDDNYFFGYIFTLSGNNLARQLLDQDLFYFFDDNEVISLELLNSMEKKIEELKSNKFLDNGGYDLWKKRIEIAKKNASR